MTTTATHTPTPWKAVSGQGAHYRDWYIRQGEKREDGSWPAVAKCCSSNIGARIVCESNAKFIETACNAHDDLLAAVRDDVRQIESLADRLSATVPPGHVDYISKSDAAAALRAIAAERRAAIRKAGGEA